MTTDSVFLVGAQRSGTTLLRLMLDHHPDIAFPGEFDFLVPPLGKDGAFPSGEVYGDWLSSHRVFPRYQLRIDPTLPYPDVARSFLDQARRRSGKDLLGVTVHQRFDQLDRIWPAAWFIHIVRDPRDVSASCIAMGWAGSAWYAVERWREAEEAWESLKRRIPENRRFEVRFEEVVTNTVSVLQGVCNFLGVAYSESMLEYPKDTTYGPVDARMAQKWATTLRAREVKRVEAKVGAMLLARGYQLSGLGEATVGPLERGWLRSYDHLYRARFRLKRFGWRLVLLGFVTRVLGLATWNRRLRKEFNEVADRFVR